MCGIVGYIGPRQAGEVLLEGLRRLEYRGYDSAGVAVLNGTGVQLRRSAGKLSQLTELLKNQPLSGHVGVGHTRWATHGRPSEENAHPHTDCNGRIVVVHNGIIENYPSLKQTLEAQGHRFRSQTDTEVLAHLIETHFQQGDLLTAVRQAVQDIQGSYALGVMASKDPDRLLCARKDSPLVIGLGDDETFLASDVPALLPYTRKVIFLEDGEVAELRPGSVRLFRQDGQEVHREPQTVLWDAVMAEKAGYKHFMLKEIFEQRLTVRDTFRDRLSLVEGAVLLEDILPPEQALNLRSLSLVACGTSYHAALVGRFWIEELAGLPCEVDIASEFRYRKSPRSADTLLLAISQSGETADTLAALRDAKARGQKTLAICNVMGSTITRDADGVLDTRCGPEIGVASTKAFTGQLTALLLLAVYLAQVRRTLEAENRRSLLQGLAHLPIQIAELLDQSPAIEKVARRFFKRTNFLYLGRHLNFPIALEGALKLKELSYIHAEGYPAGEMKHGPIALIDENWPVVAIATRSSVYEKILSNLEEVKARGGTVIALATQGDEGVAKKADACFLVPPVPEALAPFLTILPLQLLAYHIAVLRGCDVDQPRNLAKSVTVE